MRVHNRLYVELFLGPRPRRLAHAQAHGGIVCQRGDDAAKASLDKAVDTSDMIAVIDYPQEWAQIFDETWRAFRDGFYLENMHGVDWNAIRQKYAVLLPHVKTRLDLNYVIGAMISELACGHAYVNPGDTPRPENIPKIGRASCRERVSF